jgi:y4mF family transcriptional regulator
MKRLPQFVKERRKSLSLTQIEFAEKAGVGLTVIRKIEQGKDNLSLAKVNQVLLMFGHTLQPVNLKDNEKSHSKI